MINASPVTAVIEIDHSNSPGLVPFTVYTMISIAKQIAFGSVDLDEARHFATAHSSLWDCPVIDRTTDAI